MLTPPPPPTEDVKYECLRSARPSGAWGPILRALWHHLLGGRRSATQSSLTLRRHGLLPARLLFGLFLGENTGVACHFLQQGIFLTQGLSLFLHWLLHWQVDSLPLSRQEGPVRYHQPIRAPCVTINQSEPRALPSTNQSPVRRRQPIRAPCVAANQSESREERITHPAAPSPHPAFEKKRLPKTHGQFGLSEHASGPGSLPGALLNAALTFTTSGC